MKWIALLALSGCQLVFDYEGDRDVPFRGSYIANITTAENACGIMLGRGIDVPVEILQDEANVLVQINGDAGPLLDLVYASHEFIGSVSGVEINATLSREGSIVSEGCMVGMARIELVGTQDLDAGGRVIDGFLNHHQDDRTGNGCAASCVSVQTFIATRL